MAFKEPKRALTEGEKLVNAELQSIAWSWWLLSFYIPFASFLWTVYWMLEKRLKTFFLKKTADRIFRRLPGGSISYSKITALSKWIKLTIIVMDVFWILATAVFIALMAVYICNGSGTWLGQAAAWVVRLGVKVLTLNGIDFGFCKEVPAIQFN